MVGLLTNISDVYSTSDRKVIDVAGKTKQPQIFFYPESMINPVVLLDSRRAKPRIEFLFFSILKAEVFNMDEIYLASSNPLSRMLSSSRTFIAKLRSRFSRSSKASTGIAKTLVGVDLAVIVPTKFV